MTSNRILTILALSSALIAPCAVLAASQGAIELAQGPPPKEINDGKGPPPKKGAPPNQAPAFKKGPPPATKPAPKAAPKVVAPPKAAPPPKQIVPKAPPPPKVIAPKSAPPPPPSKDSFKKEPPPSPKTVAPPKTVVPPKAAPLPKTTPPVQGKPDPKLIPPPKTGKEGFTRQPPTAAPKQPVPGPKFDASKRPPPAKPPQVKDLSQIKGQRKQTVEQGGKRIVIVEPDRRRIIREDGRFFIRHDESDRFRRQWRDTRYERRGGLELAITVLPGGFTIYTEFDSDRRPLRRYRRGPDGLEVILFDNRAFYRRHRGPDWYRYAYVDLPPPVIRIPRREYIVDYEEASPDFIYDTLIAPPVDDLDRRYSLEEIRYSPSLRDRMRRVDLSSINFAFGSWEIDPSQYPKLERIADAINRIIERDSTEMIMIEGYTDAVGSEEDNLTLSDRRAESVAIILTQEFGVPSENLTTQGYGEQYLKIPTDGEEPRNRYVAVRRITPILDR